MKRREAQRFPKEVPVEGFQMAKIKNYTVAFRDRAVVQCCGADNLEQGIATTASLAQASNELLDSGGCLRRWHRCSRVHELLLDTRIQLYRPGQTELNERGAH